MPDDLKAYMLYRDANLPEKARELVELWREGLYKWDEMQHWLKHLERPIPGPPNPAGVKTQMIGFVTEEFETEADVTGSPVSAPTYLSDEPDFILMEHSFYLLPEAFEVDEETLFDALDDYYDDDAVWLAGDFPESGKIHEDILTTILANSSQVSKYLHRKAMSRGFTRQHPPKEPLRPQL